MEKRIIELELRNAELTAQLKKASKIKQLFKVVPFSKYKETFGSHIPNNDIIVLNFKLLGFESEYSINHLTKYNIPNIEYIVEFKSYTNVFLDFSELKERIDDLLDSSNANKISRVKKSIRFTLQIFKSIKTKINKLNPF